MGSAIDGRVKWGVVIAHIQFKFKPLNGWMINEPNIYFLFYRLIYTFFDEGICFAGIDLLL